MMRIDSDGIPEPSMDSRFILGIPEIDAQHEELAVVVKSLQGVIARKDQRLLIHPMMKRLNHLLVNHFKYEESLMGMVQVTDLTEHKKMHSGILKLFQDYFDQPPESGDHEQLGKLIGDRIFTHVIDYDIHMADTVKRHLATASQAKNAALA